MGKVFKATIYLCDLANDWNIDEYQEMINRHVLDRISTNGYCLIVENKSREITDEEWEDWDNSPINNFSATEKDWNDFINK